MAKAKKTKKVAVKTVRCAATTATGTRCKRMVKGGKSKFCSSHKTAASRKGPVKKKTAKTAAKKTVKKAAAKKKR